jgi:signal peptidase I
MLQPTTPRQPTANVRSSHRLQLARCGVELVVGVLIAVLVEQTWLVDGLFAPLVVSGGSMAETLLGCHRDVICDDCGHAMVCGSDADPPPAEAICVNCDHANDLADQPEIPGDRVLLDRAVFQVRTPRRWEVVALRDPRRADRLAVKRVVGLPGETVEIRDGDVYIDGQIQRKSMETQRAMAVLVHDAAHRQTMRPLPPPRWRPEETNSSWNATESGFVRPETEEEDVDWLGYHHVGRVGNQWRPCPVADVCAYNVSSPRRSEDVHDVTDLMLSVRLVETVGAGGFYVGATDGVERFELRISPERGSFEVRHNSDSTPVATGSVTIGRGGTELEVSLFDRQFCVAFDRHVVVRLPYETKPGDRRATSRPFLMGARKLGVDIGPPRIYRDVYYTHPIGLPNCWALDRPAKLGGDAYFVLGDNSPISEDSRVGSGCLGVSAGLLIGKPMVVPFSMHEVSFGPWHFQVPNLAGIRYIR